MKKWKTISSVTALDNKWMKIRKDTVELPTGKILDDFYLWVGYDVVMIAPVTPDGKLVLVKQYKHGVDDFIIEFPAGYIEDTKNIENEARRELMEETGYTAPQLHQLARFTVNPSKTTSILYFFYAPLAEKTTTTNFDANEDIETLVLSIEEVLALVKKGTIWNASVIAGVYMIQEILHLGKEDSQQISTK